MSMLPPKTPEERKRFRDYLKSLKRYELQKKENPNRIIIKPSMK